MLKVEIKESRVQYGRFFSVGFHRTLRIPDTEHTFPLPPGLGLFPVFNVEQFRGHVSEDWLELGGGFIPMYQCEALWIGFDSPTWRPHAVMVHVGGVNAVSGECDCDELCADPQNYLVCPNQLWLDGINAGDGAIRQFVAVPLGKRQTVEAAIIGEESRGGIHIRVFGPKHGLFPEEPPPPPEHDTARPMFSARPPGATKMGLGAGGWMKQKIYPDQHGIDTWDQANSGEFEIQILNSQRFAEITGQLPPPTPIDAEKYTALGMPWFELYDESLGDVGPPEQLRNVKSISQIEKQKTEKISTESPIDIENDQV